MITFLHFFKNLFIFCVYSGTPYTQQSYKVSDTFPYKWISKKWKEGFHVTSMTAAGSRWGVVMSRNAGFSEQVLSCFYRIYDSYSRMLFWQMMRIHC